MPTVAVLGVGTLVEPVLVELVYHIKLVPVALNGSAVASLQYVTGVVTVGAAS